MRFFYFIQLNFSLSTNTRSYDYYYCWRNCIAGWNELLRL